jgi:hypothetical protein
VTWLPSFARGETAFAHLFGLSPELGDDIPAGSWPVEGPWLAQRQLNSAVHERNPRHTDQEDTEEARALIDPLPTPVPPSSSERFTELASEICEN